MSCLIIETYVKLLNHFAKMCENGDTIAEVLTCIFINFSYYSKTCLKRNAIVPVFFSPPFSQVSVLQRVVF